MFDRLAFYGAKPILLLFLITATLQVVLGIERTDAAVMAANLTAYTYMAPLIGGIISDRWLGARYAISLGYIIMAIGYLVGWKAIGTGMVNDDHSCIDWNRSFQRKLKRSDRKTISEQRASGCCIFHSVFLCKCWGFRRFTAYRIFVSPLI